ncbi:MAG: 4-hydroxythreonine-4-phosphate dehydrogenase PdxA [Oxalobacteraceae bacterium]
MPCPRIAITCGEPAGIGPEISVRAAREAATLDVVLIGDAQQLHALALACLPERHMALLASPAALQSLPREPGRLSLIDCPLAARPVSGELDARNGPAVLRTLDIAIDVAMNRWVDAIVTAPVQKSTINDAGIAFTGHTEYLAEKTGTQQVVMMLAGPTHGAMLRVALATTHLSLKDVSAAITRESLSRTLSILHTDLKQQFGIADPRILVAGLNPHAGEEGYLGREEIEVITPVIEAARARGWRVSGPYPADTLFQPKYLKDADCILAMYHDQGLPVLKFATFGQGVNITLGLPIIRTSVDHGTALDMAARGSGHADDASMQTAIRLAAEMIYSSGRVSA